MKTGEEGGLIQHESILLPVLTCSTGAEPKLSGQAGHQSRNKRSARGKKKKQLRH